MNTKTNSLLLSNLTKYIINKQTKMNTTNNSIENKKTPTEYSKNWLQRLKDESWEAELLVSAIAIFGTSQLFKIIDWSTNMFIDILPPNQYLIAYYIMFFGLFAISVLVSMFVIHFILRAYWVGLVGLNSVFPDYSVENSVYSKIYTEKIISILPKLKDSIKKVDELCSVIFSVAFTLLFTYSYMALFSSLYLGLYNILSSFIPSYILLIPAVIILLTILLQMIFGIIANMKKYKENEKIQNWFFQMAKKSSVLTLGPLYKSIMQTMMIFGSNFKKKKAMIYLLITFIFSGIIVTSYKVANTNILYLIQKGKHISFDKTRIYPSYYQTENTAYLLTPEIASDIIESNILKVFIPVFKHETKMSESVYDAYTKDVSKSKNEQRDERRLHNLNRYKKYNQVYLNDEKVVTDFIKYNHPKTKQFGILCYLKLTDALDSKNTITIKKVYGNDNDTEWTIPFHYIPKQ